MSRTVITREVVERLVAEQFPEWADLSVTSLKANGWDNTTFRLGDELSVRLPNGAEYATQVDHEHRWLPMLAPHLPLPIPTPVAKGEPSSRFELPWSIYRWIPGTTATLDAIDDLPQFASDLADFLRALHAIDPSGGPAGEQQTHRRGGAVSQWDRWTRKAIAGCASAIDETAVTQMWERSLSASDAGAPVWVHGDIGATNLLVADGLVTKGQLSAVIDFGCSAVGDPACDLMVAHIMFDQTARDEFRAKVGVNDATWERGRGWATWKALLVLQDEIDGAGTQPKWHEMGWRSSALEILNDLLAES